MPDITDLIKKWWKQMFAMVLLPVLVVGVIVFLKPRQYLSVATAIPGSSFANDKSAIFNENIQALYTAFGSSDDLDRIVGTAGLDTVYLTMTDKFNLFDHYKITGNTHGARVKAAAQLKGNTKIMKSGYGELKVKVWDTDKQLAPQLANAIVEKLNGIHQSLQNQNNLTVLQNLKDSRTKITFELDSLTNSLQYDSANALIRSTIITLENRRAGTIRRDALLEQLAKYEKLINEYQLMADSRNAVLVVVEPARTSERPDRPKGMQLMTAAAVLGALFSLLVALLLERTKNPIS